MKYFDPEVLETLSKEVGRLLTLSGLSIATAESCTGGWVAQCLTSIAGSSAWFERGFVTYSNAAKCEMLGVEADTLALHGAVSEAVAEAMARGALRHSHADLALSITGIAGPEGGSPEKPVGTVWFGWVGADGRCETQVCRFDGPREVVRACAVAHALRKILSDAAVLQA